MKTVIPLSGPLSSGRRATALPSEFRDSAVTRIVSVGSAVVRLVSICIGSSRFLIIISVFSMCEQFAEVSRQGNFSIGG